MIIVVFTVVLKTVQCNCFELIAYLLALLLLKRQCIDGYFIVYFVAIVVRDDILYFVADVVVIDKNLFLVLMYWRRGLVG